MSGAGLTVTADVVLAANLSVTVSVTLVTALTLFGSSVTVLPFVAVWTGSVDWSDEKIWYGGCPPWIVRVAGVIEYAVNSGGCTTSSPGVLNTLFGDPLPLRTRRGRRARPRRTNSREC